MSTPYTGEYFSDHRVYPPYPHSGLHPWNQHCPAVTDVWQVSSESSDNHFHHYTFWYTCVLWHFETAHLDVRNWHKDLAIALHSSAQAWDCYVTCRQGQAYLKEAGSMFNSAQITPVPVRTSNSTTINRRRSCTKCPQYHQNGCEYESCTHTEHRIICKGHVPGRLLFV